MAKGDKYNPPIATMDNVNIYTHNRAHMAPGHATAAAYAPDETATTSQVLDDADTRTLRGIFNDIATHDKTRAHDGKGQLIIFHAVDPDDDVNLLNSKLPKLHFHIIAGELAEDSAHIGRDKTYVPIPNPDMADDLRKLVAEQGINEQTTISLSGSDIAEAAAHDVLVHPGYSGLADFTTNAPDSEIEKFRKNMKDLIAPYTQKGAGGARIIIDERYNPAGFLAVHLIGGEQLGQQPDKSHRWFQTPKGPGA